MILKKAAFLNFRNIESAEISFSPGVNLLFGNNAQGKTNALEGIYLCAQGRSHRTAHEKDYIRQGGEFAKVTVDFADKLRDQQLELRYLKNGRKYCRKNGLAVRKMSEFIGSFRAVIFCPEYLAIVREGPSERRAFMDAALCQLDPVYLSALQTYAAALMQRNKLIALYPADPKPFEETEELWAEQMASAG
ncbi:MAG: AAA family ATPase, partial [Lentisphaeria bacterium]|nr:AAA family ATPase [Lentisphaeria bacterium]